MDATSAVADLTEISSQIVHAVVLLEDGSVLASTIAAEEHTKRLATTALDLLAAAAEVPLQGERELAQLEVALGEGSVFVVRDGGRLVVATAVAGAPSGLVLYDLRTCLRAIDEPGEETTPPPRTRTPRRKTAADA
jgi:predicted regulator of Ras-like GTPase activity (Roadblock/LC7/MglB family)